MQESILIQESCLFLLFIVVSLLVGFFTFTVMITSQMLWQFDICVEALDTCLKVHKVVSR